MTGSLTFRRITDAVRVGRRRVETLGPPDRRTSPVNSVPEHDLMGGSIHRIGQVPIVTGFAFSYETLRCEKYSLIEIIAETKNMHAENLPE